MFKTAAIALIFGFIGAALYGRLFPPASPYDYLAIAKYTDEAGNTLPPAQVSLIQKRADAMAKAGFIILNDSAMYSYPSALKVPQNVAEENR